MGFWLVDADVLANSRFALSPLLETVAAMGKLADSEVAPWERSWLDAHRARFRARVDGDPFSRALIDEVLGRRWIPDFMARPPGRGTVSFDAELARVRSTPPEAALTDLQVTVGGDALPAAVQVDDPARVVADLLAWVWTHTVRADWPRRRRLPQYSR